MGEEEFLQTRARRREIHEERHMPEARHCRHCLGDCPGDCLFGDSGLCIHGWNERPPRQFGWQTVLTRTWWHRFFRGIG